MFKPFFLIFVIGCDQKHEEEMDPEAIYKNFSFGLVLSGVY